MYTYILFILCLVVCCSENVLADGDNEVKRGAFPFMAFIYYLDETIVDTRGLRFLRSAALIRPAWLVTSAVGPSVLNSDNASFPQKTLLARLGAITINSNITLNEDEDEQEREVIQIVRPYNHGLTQWWLTDISLMKTLMPFNVTFAVDVATFNFKRDYIEKNCFILVYTRLGNLTEDRVLMQLPVALQPSTIEACGSHFSRDTMLCATDIIENEDDIYDPNFCQGNSGGPLLCNNKIIGIQTYVENNCKQPHLYQLMAAWHNFITCGTSDACLQNKCVNVCVVADKDNPVAEIDIIATELTNDIFVQTETNVANPASTTTRPEKLSTPDDIVMSSGANSVELTPTKTTIFTNTTKDPTTTKLVSTTTTMYVTRENDDTTETTDWPTVKGKEIKEIERRISVEAQQVATVKSGAKATMCVLKTTVSTFLVLACLV